jgi:hypothetical protein
MATLTPAARNGITGVMPLRMRKLQLAWLLTETLRRSMSCILASVWRWHSPPVDRVQ